jgi:hypothetical protein
MRLGLETDMARNEPLIAELDAAVAVADEANTVDKTTMLLVAAREEIERLNVVVHCCCTETERIYRWINERRGEKVVEIVRKKIEEE